MVSTNKMPKTFLFYGLFWKVFCIFILNNMQPNSRKPGQTSRSVAFDLGVHCLLKLSLAFLH